MRYVRSPNFFISFLWGHIACKIYWSTGLRSLSALTCLRSVNPGTLTELVILACLVYLIYLVRRENFILENRMHFLQKVKNPYYFFNSFFCQCSSNFYVMRILPIQHQKPQKALVLPKKKEKKNHRRKCWNFKGSMLHLHCSHCIN
jgi:hypothetical protein